MSEDVQAEAPVEDPKVAEAEKLLREAMKALKPEEVQIVKGFMAEVDEAANAPGSVVENRQLEFCYTVKFSQSKLSNARLLRAAEAYIAAIEG